jgi:hypothetical protein
LGKSSIDAARPRAQAKIQTKAPKQKKKAAKLAKAGSKPSPKSAAPAAKAQPAAQFTPAAPPPVAPLTLHEVKKDHTAWMPGVGAMLKKYGAADDLNFSRPIERILNQAAVIDNMFVAQANGSDGLVQGLVKVDARRTVFMLEGFLRLYGKELGNKGAKALENVKTLEDNLGNYGLHDELLQQATDAKLPGSIIDALEEGKQKQHSQYEKFVESMVRPDDKGRSPLIAQVIDALVAHQDDFHGYEHDRRNTFERLGKLMHHLQDDKFDMTQPVTGIHELRRHIRWLPVDIEALNGLVVLDDKINPVPAYQAAMKTSLTPDGKPLAESKFVNLPAPTREPDALHVSKSLYTATMDLVLKLGAIKDHYEPLTLIADLYVKQGLAKDVSQARAMLDPLLDPKETERDYQQQAQALYTEFHQNNLFGAMASEYDAAAVKGGSSAYPA